MWVWFNTSKINYHGVIRLADPEVKQYIINMVVVFEDNCELGLQEKK